MTPLALFGAILFLCLLIWGVRELLRAFGIGDPLRTVIWVGAVFLYCAWLGDLFGLYHLGGRFC